MNEVTASVPNDFSGVLLKDMYPIDWAYDDVSPACPQEVTRLGTETNTSHSSSSISKSL